MVPSSSSAPDEKVLERSVTGRPPTSSLGIPPVPGPASGPLPVVLAPAPAKHLPAKTPGEKHIPALDGIRGIAILLVILHHSLKGWEPARTGVERMIQGVLGHCWVGVDLFFVLSGFLITGILIDTQGKKGYFSSFYPRRMLRTFPLYYVSIFVCFVAIPALAIPGSQWLADLSSRQGWFWLHVSNFYNLNHNILRADGPSIGWMSTFWSLAVEEHFYLVWPLVVCWSSARRLVLVCLSLIVGGLLLRSVWTAHGVDFQYVYNNTFSRLDGMLFGSLVAALSRSARGLRSYLPAFRWLVGISAAGLALLVLLGSRVRGLYPFCAQTIVFTAIAAIFAGILVLVLEAPPGSRTRRLLSGRLLQACGKYSYAMYILNIPLFLLIDVFFRPEDLRILDSRIPGIVAYMVLGIALSLGAALVTWNLLEKHCLKQKRYFVTR